MILKKPQRLAVLSLVSVMIFLASGCSKLDSVVLPPLPTYSDEVEVPVESSVPAAPRESTVPALSATEVPVVSTKPEPTPSPTPAPDPNIPQITISGETLPEDMLCYNIATLHGLIKTDKGQLSMVKAQILDAEGREIQSCAFTPMLSEFSLAGTVNAALRFAVLEPGDYTYVLSVTADYNGKSYDTELTRHEFSLFAEQTQMEAAESAEDAEIQENADKDGEPVYTAKITQDSSNAGLIWNFFSVYLDNPYGAAAVLANIEVESACQPTRLQNDFTDGFMISEYYTIQVDDEVVSRDGFVSSYSMGEDYGPGYGLCQWSFERKGGLYDLAKDRGTSIGDLDTQCIYIVMELEMQFPELLDLLKTTDDVREAAREFFYVYEQGAEMGNRAGIAEDYLEKYALLE